MQALCWTGVNQLKVERVPDPAVLKPHDVIVKVSLSSVCGSDLHLIDGLLPTMRAGDILGHEFIGEIVEAGPDVRKLRVGERVVVSPVIACGHCTFCQNHDWALCDNSNPNDWLLDQIHGAGAAGLFGSSHAFGGYAGSHAEYVRVPFAEHGCTVVPPGVSDESAVFVSDAFPTGYYAADLAGVEIGDTVAVWGAGAVGLMAMHSAYLKGAERVIAIDCCADRLEVAKTNARAEVLNFLEVDVHEALKELTGGRLPDRCIDAVGMEAYNPGLEEIYDRAKQLVNLGSPDRSTALRQAIRSCRKGGTVAIVGVYGESIQNFPMASALTKGLTLKMGQQPSQRYASRLFDHIQNGEIDPSYLLTHKLPLESGIKGYELFKERQDGCLRAVFAPALRVMS